MQQTVDIKQLLAREFTGALLCIEKENSPFKPNFFDQIAKDKIIILVGIDDHKKGDTHIVSYKNKKVRVVKKESTEDEIIVYEYNLATKEAFRNNTFLYNGETIFKRLIREFRARNENIQAYEK